MMLTKYCVRTRRRPEHGVYPKPVGDAAAARTGHKHPHLTTNPSHTRGTARHGAVVTSAHGAASRV